MKWTGPVIATWFGWVGMMVSGTADGGTYGGGAGIGGNPYQIRTVADWQELIATPTDWSTQFILVNDIDFGGANLTPVAPDTDSNGYGYQGTPFSGLLDGKGFVLHNAVMALPNEDYVGLFGYLGNGCQIRNLGVKNFIVTGRGSVGGLCGYNDHGTIRNCHTTGPVTGKVTGESMYLGGLCGGNYFGTISHSYATGKITGNTNTYGMGGLCGANWGGTIVSCYAAGEIVLGSYYLGGLCGQNEQGIISDCYAMGNVSGIGTLGGLVGTNSQGKVLRCFSTGTPTGTSFVGGLCGYRVIGGNYEDSGNFWDTQISQVTDSYMGTGKTTTEMKTKSVFIDAGWDFAGEISNGTADLWRMCMDGAAYPRLEWEFLHGGDFNCPNGVGMEDLLYLSRWWLGATPETIGAADTNSDGTVNLSDFAILAKNWTHEAP